MIHIRRGNDRTDLGRSDVKTDSNVLFHNAPSHSELQVLRVVVAPSGNDLILIAEVHIFQGLQAAVSDRRAPEGLQPDKLRCDFTLTERDGDASLRRIQYDLSVPLEMDF
jgi:hypothetical protein